MGKFFDWLFDGFRYLFLGCLFIWTLALVLIFALAAVGVVLQVIHLKG